MLDGAGRNAETGGDVFDGRVLIDQFAEGLEFIGGMHALSARRSPHGVLGEADFRGAGLRAQDLAGDGVVVGDLAVLELRNCAGASERDKEDWKGLLQIRLVGPPRFELGTSCTPSKKYQSLTDDQD